MVGDAFCIRCSVDGVPFMMRVTVIENRARRNA